MKRLGGSLVWYIRCSYIWLYNK